LLLLVLLPLVLLLLVLLLLLLLQPLPPLLFPASKVVCAANLFQRRQDPRWVPCRSHSSFWVWDVGLAAAV